MNTSGPGIEAQLGVTTAKGSVAPDASSAADSSAVDPFDFLKCKPDAPKPEVAEPKKSAKELHDDEMAWFNAYRNDPHTSSFLWAAVRGGAVIAQEYDRCDCDDRAEVDPTAHRHSLSDLPGRFVPVVVGQADSFDREHNPIKVDVTIPAFEAREAFEAFTFHAVPITLQHQSLPDLSIDIEPGMKIIWGHRTRQNVTAGGSFYVDSLVFGRILGDGTQEVHQVYCNGDHFEHESLDAAHAHEHDTFVVPDPVAAPAATEPEHGVLVVELDSNPPR